MLWRLAGGLAIAHLVLMLGGFSLQRVAPLGARSGTVAADYVRWSTTKAFTGAYVDLLAFLVFVLAATLLARLMRGESEVSGWLSSIIAATGSIYVAVTLATAMADSSAAHYAGRHGAPLATVTALGQVHWFGVALATGVLGVFTLAVAAAAFTTGLLPRWVSYAGVVAGAACLVGAVPGAREGLVDYATLIWMVWFVGLGVAALRRPRLTVVAAPAVSPIVG
jgi:hypothetical protein